MRNLDDPSKYASSEFAAAAIDEVTKNRKVVFDQLRSVVRWPGIEDTRILGATNPGGLGHDWVKRLWISREFNEQERREEKEYKFIPALAYDNPHLSQGYIDSLAALPENLRKAYLEGSWDLFEGQYFNEWRESIHTCEPFDIPTTWRRIRTVDHGRTAPTAGYWGAIDYDGTIYWYREYYKAGVDADINAAEIARLSSGEKYWFTVLDSSCFAKTGAGETIADIYARNGVVAEPWPKNRLAGWSLFHEYLRPQRLPTTPSDDKPRMIFFNTCYNATRTIPTLIHDEKHPEDLDSGGEDHSADAVRGALEYLNEAKSPKPLEGVEQRLWEMQQKSKVNAQGLNKLYYGRGRR